jgi:type IV pilus assembly protein PilC
MRKQDYQRPDAAPPPLLYLQRIDQALVHRGEIAEQLNAIRLAPESKGFRSEIDSFVLALQSDLDARDFVKEGAFAAWLAAILEWDVGPKVRSRQISQLATSISRNADIRWTRSLTLTYLGTLLFAVFATFVFLCGTVIPIFGEMFNEFQLTLPLPTQIVLWFSSTIGPHAKEIFLIAIASFIMFRLGKRISRRLSQDRFIASFAQRFSRGSTSRVVAMSRCMISLASLIKIGAPLPEALVISGRASQSELLVQHAVRLSNELKSLPIEQCPSAKAFPPIVVDSLREKGLTQVDPGITADLLRELGIIYCERARHRHEWILRFLLPLFLVLIGGLLTFVIFALFLPLTSLVTSLSG